MGTGKEQLLENGPGESAFELSAENSCGKGAAHWLRYRLTNRP
ncbi:hypothetical protein [Paenibacillus nasutitermitis]|nr:hypothetical protein [Paenibacillus nasutitermitis]